MFKKDEGANSATWANGAQDINFKGKPKFFNKSKAVPDQGNDPMPVVSHVKKELPQQQQPSYNKKAEPFYKKDYKNGKQGKYTFPDHTGRQDEANDEDDDIDQLQQM